MIKYLINLGVFYQPKNSLHKSIQNFIGTQQRRVINDSNLESYKEYLSNAIERLNSDHPKCTPVKIHFWGSESDEHLQLESVVSLSMLKFEEVDQ